MFEFDRQTHLCLCCPIPRIQPSLRPRSNPLAWFVVPIWSRATSPSPKDIQLPDIYIMMKCLFVSDTKNEHLIKLPPSAPNVSWDLRERPKSSLSEEGQLGTH